MSQRLLRILPLLVLLAAALPLHAHVGSPDVYEQGDAGPYRLFIVIRPPQVIPGVADIEVRSQTGGIDGIDITPMPMVGEASKHPPVPDAMKRPTQDAQYFTGHLWIMQSGSWQIRFQVRGSQGSGVLSIPVAATALRTTTMQAGMGIFLACLGLLLVVGMVGIVGAAAREAKLKPGEVLPKNQARKGYVAMTVTFVLLVSAVVLGNRWWQSEALDYAHIVYKPLQMQAAIEPGNVLDLRIVDPGWFKQRKLDDFVPDHDHLMHLYLLRWPGMDVVFHLHPDQVAAGDFRLALPEVPAGNYRLYADVVHSSGFPETMVSDVKLPKYVAGRPLSGDDAEGTAEPLTVTGGAAELKESYKLPDGYTMEWKKPSSLLAKAPEAFTFTLLDPNGQPPKDMALYMGMQGHAAFVKTDGTVFAHIHPAGSAPMAAMMLAQAQNQPANPAPQASMAMEDMPGMASTAGIPDTVSFPYGFPKPGNYRIFVQMKHGDTVETGVFDAVVPQ